MPKVKTVGITGQSGFIGSFLYSYIRFIEPRGLRLVDFKDDYFKDQKSLENFAKKCDVIVHLAGMSRGEEKEIYQTNLEITEKLIGAIKEAKVRSHIIFASSIHEKTNSAFGRSKKRSRLMLSHFALKNRSKFTGLIIPHVFGPFAKPFHNSALTTFCYQLTHHQKPKVITDGELKLIYVERLAQEIVGIIKAGKSQSRVEIAAQTITKVSSLLEKLKSFQKIYLLKQIIPQLDDEFSLNLFNTFRSYLEGDDRNVHVLKHLDPRGYFCELIKLQRTEGQVSFSVSKPKVVRGDHFHTRKIERFCVIEGDARIKIRKVGESEAYTYHVSGEKPSFVDIPVWYAHNIENVGKKPLVTLFWANEIFNKKNPDTFWEKV